jgi:hypothetical protein
MTMAGICEGHFWPQFTGKMTDNSDNTYRCKQLRNNGLCFDKIISLYFGAPKTTTINIGAKRKWHFLHLPKNLPKMAKM